jgi:hypothetical protein
VKKLVYFWPAAGLVLALSGCASPQQQVAQKEDLFAAAGFQAGGGYASAACCHEAPAAQ